MIVEVLTPEKVLFKGEASGVRLPGIDGGFEILENHAPIISALSDGKIEISSSSGKTNLNCKSGFVECLKNKVVVLVEGGDLA